MSSQIRRKLLVGALESAVLAGLILGLGALGGAVAGRRFNLTELAALAPAVVLGAHLLAHFRWNPPDTPPETPASEPSDAGAFSRLDSLDLRIRSATRQTSSQYQTVVRPILIAVAEDRLARHHAIDWQNAPDDARELLGEQLWRLLRDGSVVAPTMRQLRAAVERIERL